MQRATPKPRVDISVFGASDRKPIGATGCAMVSDELKRAKELRRKRNIPPEHRTDDRDAAADIIEEMWPAQMSEIADASPYTRQHIANTLEYYFEPGDDIASATVDIPIKDIDADRITLQFTVNIHLDQDGEVDVESVEEN